MKKIREPVVAGYFYPGEKKQLLQILDRFVDRDFAKTACRAAVCPHAGYVYSGATAGAVFSRVEIPETVILLGPNHTGYGEPYAVDAQDSWITPLGETEVDRKMAEALVKNSRYLEEDSVAHLKEHSLEVQLPFLQFLKKNVRIVPVALSGYVDDPAWSEIGESIAQAVAERGEGKALIVASSDMTHYEDQTSAEEKDRYAVEAILALDEQLLVRRIYEKDISMCGYGPVITAVIAAKNLGAKEAELVRYATSGEASKNYAQVVGYAGILIS
ncbi:MAG: AmmeMemoRadiSam system protein B [Candidatus Omnitrophica bacterium]|nr:AmmeMemoRadiSam system protein B [Candidatus Omnitrophota bacterium]